MNSQLDPRSIAKLRKFLAESFSIEELKDLAFDLGVDFELFAHTTKATLVRELIHYFIRRGHLRVLVLEILKIRQDACLIELLQILPPAPASKKVQVILSDSTPTDENEMRRELAKLFNVKADEIEFTSAAWGSMYLLINLPKKALDDQSLANINQQNHLVSVTPFSELDALSQQTWRLIAHEWPASRENGAIQPVIRWYDVAREIVGNSDRFATRFKAKQLQRNHVDYQVAVSNKGNATSTYRINGRSPSNELQLQTTTADQLTLAPTQEEQMHIEARARQPRLFGRAEKVPLTLEVQSASGNSQAWQTEFILKPMLTPTLIGSIMFCLLLILLLFNQFRMQTGMKSAQFNPEQIAFVSNHLGHNNIYSINEDGSDLKQITSNDHNTQWPAWSPDGNQIAFAQQENHNSDIFIMNANSQSITQLTNNEADNSYPTWSPDGKQLAFSTNRDGNWEIYTMSKDGQQIRRITNHAGDDLAPAWSPDGNQIVYQSNRDGDWELYTTHVNSSDEIQLTMNEADDMHPTWSPDGKWLAFQSDQDGNNEIYLAKADGSNKLRLTNNLYDDRYPDWSINSDRVIFESLREDEIGIYTIETDGQHEQKIPSEYLINHQPIWRPSL